MARIFGRRVPGAPGWRTRGLIPSLGGGRVPADKASKSGVRRLFARDPSKGAFVNIGTEKDILDFTNDPDIPNTTGAPNPRVVDGSTVKRSATPKHQNVVNRSSNRRLRRS